MGVVDPTKLKTKLACILEADDSTECVWEILNHIIIKTILQENETALQFGSQIYSYASNYEDFSCKSSGGQGIGNIGENFGVEPDESQK